MGDIMKVVGIGCAAIVAFLGIFLVVFGAISAGIVSLWYTFDDHLAAALELPGLGELPWYTVFPAIIFFSWIFGGSSIVSKIGND